MKISVTVFILMKMKMKMRIEIISNIINKYNQLLIQELLLCFAWFPSPQGTDLSAQFQRENLLKSKVKTLESKIGFWNFKY